MGLLLALFFWSDPVAARDDQQAIRAQILRQFGGELRDPRVTGFLAGVGRRLSVAAGHAVRITALDSDVVNAFTTGSDEVFVTRGVLAIANSEAEVAGVLGHELGHILAGHAAQRLARGEAGQHLAEFSQAQEFAADETAVALLRRAGYAPLAMAQFLETLRDQSDLEARLAGHAPGERLNILSTHPLTRDRIAHSAALAGGREGEAGDIDRQAYWQAVDGMLWGDSPSQGFVRGNRFVHPDMKFQFAVPPGFQLRNSPAQVEARRGDGALIRLTSDGMRQARTLRDYLRQAWLPNATVTGLREFSLHGRAAITGLATADSDRGPAEVRILAVRWNADSVLRFLFVFPGPASPQMEALFESVADSLDDAGQVRPRPLHLRVVTAGANDTVRSLAATMPFDELREERLRVLNGYPIDWEVRPGARVKLIQ